MARNDSSSPHDAAPRQEAELWRYIDREMTAQDMAALSSRLRDDAALREQYESFRGEANLMRRALSEHPFGGSIASRVMDEIQSLPTEASEVEYVGAGAFASAGVGGGHGRDDPFEATASRTSRRLTLLVLVFLIPTLTFISIWKSVPEVSFLGTFRIAAVDAHRGWAKFGIEGGRQFRTVSGQQNFSLRAGERFEVPEGVTLEFDLQAEDGGAMALLSLDGPAYMVVPSAASHDDFRAHVFLGRLRCNVEKRSDGQSFQVLSPDAVASVLGTEFEVTVNDAETILSVNEGAVAWGRPAAARLERVEAGETRRLKVLSSQASVKSDPTSLQDEGASSGAASSKADGGPMAKPADAGSVDAGNAGEDVRTDGNPVTANREAETSSSSTGGEAPSLEAEIKNGRLDRPVGREKSLHDEEDPPKNP